MIPTLPQNDTPAQRLERDRQLAQAQKELTYDFDTTVKPLGVAASLPRGQGFSPLLLAGAATVVLAILDDVLSMASALLHRKDPGSPLATWTEDELAEVRGALADLRALRDGLRDQQDLAVLDARAASGSAVGRGLHKVGGALERLVGRGVEELSAGLEAVDEGVLAVEQQRAAARAGAGPYEMLDLSLGLMFKLELLKLLKEIELYGRPEDLYAFVRQFSMRPPPTVISQWDEDAWFARLRLAGPNPMVIQGVSALPASFPVTDAQYQRIMGPDDSLARAGQEGRLFLCDYAALASIRPPHALIPGEQKYLTAPMVLLATPPVGVADRALRPVAAQLGQSPDGAPMLQPGDEAWPLARIFVNSADGNHHELISHLGLTHLVLEEFAMATPRQLAPEHPLCVLLTPHLHGTLAINNSAVDALIAPGGTVDKLLAGRIEDSVATSVSAVAGADLSQMAVPVALAARKVDDPLGLPDFPYRDDALLLWGAVQTWVSAYLGVYYKTPADIAGDYELKGWLGELASPQGGQLQGIPSFPPSMDELVSLVSTAVFTASVQHAAVNFPQSTIMSFTPAMPLASYAKPPKTADAARPSSLDTMPPLQEGLRQNAIGSLLGGVYYTRLGDYDRYQLYPWFQDPAVAQPLADFQRALIDIEAQIGRRNLARVGYTTLLPSLIPQSINI